jgi:hypothetical protein
MIHFEPDYAVFHPVSRPEQVWIRTKALALARGEQINTACPGAGSGTCQDGPGAEAEAEHI